MQKLLLGKNNKAFYQRAHDIAVTVSDFAKIFDIDFWRLVKEKEINI